MRQLGVGLLVLLVVAFVVYRVVMPFTPVWIDIAFIGLFALFFVVVRLATRGDAANESKQESSPD